jgi:intein/homing endonuclease
LSGIYCIDENGKYNEATSFFEYQNEKIINIKTSLNYEIGVTLNHPLTILNNDGVFEWKEASRLKIGDTLVLGKGKPSFDFVEINKNDLGLKWNTELAWILGVFIAEGSYRRNIIEIANYNNSLKDRVRKFAKSIGVSYINRPERITLNSKKFVNFLKENGFKTGAHNKCIPEMAFNSGEYIIELLKGMWLGDGNLGKHKTKNTNEASYSTVSKILAQQVHLLLLTLGIPASIYNYPNVGTSGSYTVSIKGKFVQKLQEILELPSWKITRDLIQNHFNSPNSLRIPNIDNLVKKVYTKTWKGTNWYPYIGKSRFSQNSLDLFIKDAKSNNVNKEYIQKLEAINNKNIFYVDIVKISDGIATVYDVEVPKKHYFIANGFISHNSQSQSELVGSVNFAKLEDHGIESHPLAYNFDGELNVANRGLMEFIEMLKVDPKFRHILLTLAQEKRIKVERFPLIYADLVPIAHTNENEYNKFVANKTEEALHDRLWVVKFPYNLGLDNEVKIYEKLICQTPGFKDIHIAPHTLLVAGMFAVLSRLEEPKDKGITLLQKMQLYNNEDVDGFTKQNVKELQKESEREGLDGISPRYVINRLSACFARHGVTTVTPISALRSIEEGLTTNAKLNKEDVVKLKNLIAICVEEYSKIACNEVQKAFFVNFEHEISTLLSNYIDNVGAYLDDNKVENEWGDLVDPDESLMRGIEEKVEVTNTGKDSFREEVYRKMIRSKSETGNYDYQSHPKLKEALQKQLFDERKPVIKLTVSVRNPDEEALKKINDVIKILVDQYGYNVESANELLRYVSHIMSKNK